MPRHLLLASLLSLAAAPAMASTTVPVSLRVDLAAQQNAEKAFKGFIDQWADSGLDLTFKARPSFSLDRPGWVRVYFDGLSAKVNPAWYQRFRTFHAQLLKQPFAAEVFRHAATYCRNGKPFMQGDCLGAGGQVLFAGPVHNMLGMSSAQDTQLFLFVNHTRKPLPAAPPNVAYLIHGSIGDPIYLDVPADVANNVSRIRFADKPGEKWPQGDPKAP